MINIIKTAIITIVISFISGLLLDYYKNLAPKILCTIGNGIPMAINNKRIFAYIITVSNVSNKIIHELTLNIQSSQNDLKITDAKITKGLKFDSSIKNNILDVYIPFLSNGDKFSVTLYVENAVPSKPVIIMRSPENFKRINSIEQNGILSLLFNIPKNINQAIWKIMKKSKTAVPNKKGDFTKVINKASGAEKTTNKENRKIIYKNKKPSRNKGAMIIIASIILVMIVGVLGKSYLKGKSTNNTTTPPVKTTVHKQSNNTEGSTGGTNKSTDTKTSTDGTAGNADSKTSTDGTTGNTDSNSSTGGTSGNTDSKASTGGTSGNTDSKASTGGTSGNTDSKTSTGGTSGNTDSNSSTGGTSGNTNSNSSTGESTGNTGGTTENTGN